ncbi:alanyl-tRNA editing protein [Tuberibacillus sp. Marseille-P3662]|uniref:alanyl-tRNA editing protein n=1 Tax=Tuberibacillus sp. Marseille-P3662 TaxID=1965358 RepID=UPI000A1C9DA3|nr:DHHA1 domain-containing protein [Tuberibacillus sp. Marseille-P3662]
MSTHKPLYYKDAYITAFDAHITKQGQDDDGRSFVILDETAFYPTGGGQPHDIGTLNGIKVIDVDKTAEGIRHYLEKPLPEDHTDVKGLIDWERRFDHMQQHSGQHILSAVFADEFEMPTIGFHLGETHVTIDLDTDHLEEDQAQEAERLANDIVFENRAIVTKWVNQDQIPDYPLRKIPEVDGQLRLVVIEGIDYNACGGTHPDMTAEVGPIKILGWERHRQKIRLTFVCGRRTLHVLSEQNQILQASGQKFDGSPKELPQKIDKLMQNYNEVDDTLKATKRELMDYEMKDMLSRASDINGTTLIKGVFFTHDIKELQHMTGALTEGRTSTISLVVSKHEGRLHVVAASSQDHPLNMNDIMKQGLKLIDGKGGGNSNRAQGGGKALLSGEGLLQQFSDIVKAKLG